MSPQFFLSTQNVIPFSRSHNGHDGSDSAAFLNSQISSGVADASGHREANGDSDCSDSGGADINQTSNPSSAFAVVEIRECLLRYLKNLNSTDDKEKLTSDFFGGSQVLHRLAKALVVAGIEPRKLDDSAENAVRLAIVASLFDLRVSPSAPPEKKRQTAPIPKWRLIRVLKYIDAKISDRLSLADLATVAGISRMYFASQFRAATGVRPHDYVQRRRIEYAQQLLLTSSQPLSEVAQSAGFQTQSHFTTTFKRFVGRTPHQWRREQQNAG
jgi:AraC family transcriptional regulator